MTLLVIHGFEYCPIFPRHPTSLRPRFAPSDKIPHKTWIYNLDYAGPPPTPFHLRYGFRYSLPPRFVRPLPSAHHRSLMTRRWLQFRPFGLRDPNPYSGPLG